jgi:maleate cis-trans isomerase
MEAELLRMYERLLEKYHLQEQKLSAFEARLEAAEKLRLPTVEELTSMKKYMETKAEELSKSRMGRKGFGQ